MNSDVNSEIISELSSELISESMSKMALPSLCSFASQCISLMNICDHLVKPSVHPLCHVTCKMWPHTASLIFQRTGPYNESIIHVYSMKTPACRTSRESLGGEHSPNDFDLDLLPLTLTFVTFDLDLRPLTLWPWPTTVDREFLQPWWPWPLTYDLNLQTCPRCQCHQCMCQLSANAGGKKVPSGGNNKFRLISSIAALILWQLRA